MGNDVVVPAVDDIEFIDVSGGEVGETTEIVATRSVSRFWPVVMLLAIGAWALGSVGAGVDDPASDAPRVQDGPSPTVAPISPMLDNDQAIGGRDASVVSAEPTLAAEPAPWPSPPADRDPYVVRIPGRLDVDQETIDRTLVYVNSNGTPTVVSLATRDVFEVGVAAIRVHETFAVQDGEVRSLEGANPGLQNATASAVVFHTYRDVDRPGVGTSEVDGSGRGPELCLSATSCAPPDQGLGRWSIGGVTVERFDPGDHADVALIFNRWEPVDRWLVAPDGYRIPIATGQIWVITPDRSEAGSGHSVW